MFFSALTQMLPYIRDGRLKGLAVTSAARSPLAPEIPTMVESGYDQFVTESITFIVAPPGTPLPIRKQIGEAVVRALATDEVKAYMATAGIEIVGSTPAEFARFFRAERDQWAKVVRDAKIQTD